MTSPKTSVAALVFAWAFVGSPLVWGILQTLKKAAALFH
jgi:hypothetical protein